MSSLNHEGLVEIVRQHPPVALGLLRLVGTFALPDKVTATLGSEDMTAVLPRTNKRRQGGRKPDPSKYTADSVVIISDASAGERLLAVIIEPQGRDDEDKSVSWPAYVVNARKANKVPRAVLIAACWNDAEAAKLRNVTAIGHPGFVFIPLVVDPSTPFGLDNASPYLKVFAAALGAIDTGTDAGARMALDAIIATGASAADRKTLAGIILGVATGAAHKRLEELMSITYRDPFIEGWIDRGKAEGKAVGEAVGKAEAKAEAILKLVRSRDIRLTAAQRTSIATSTDIAELDTWFDRALTATSADDIFDD